MDVSVSYHPITKEQMQEWYFDIFEDMGAASELKLRIPKEQLKKHTLEELETYYKDKYITIMKRSRDLDYDNFNKWHAYFIAIAQGFFEKFYFVHGSAISSIIDPEFHNTYVTAWEEVIPSDYIEGLSTSKKLDGAFSAGAYISPGQVKKLLKDYENDSEIKDLLNGQFVGSKIEVLLAALNYASKNNQGLLEATKVIDQSTELFEEPSCFSNVFNCDVLSAAVYTSDLAKKFDEIYKGTGD
ncbi:MAG: hypothetical protein COA92_01060 [Sulfurovum sp.]|nr:MAG: hypothetical protein COA92_01060 [Sulfurovum sp.]